jgi:hypothetical protein
MYIPRASKVSYFSIAGHRLAQASGVSLKDVSAAAAVPAISRTELAVVQGKDMRMVANLSRAKKVAR